LANDGQESAESPSRKRGQKFATANPSFGGSETGSQWWVRARSISMDLRIENKTAVVTGSTAGIGLAIASLLASEGADVVVNGRTQGRVDEAVRKLEAGDAEEEGGPPSRKLRRDTSTRRGRVRGVAADLSTAVGVHDFVKEIPEADILVNNLGIFEPKPF
jgi:NAD(P)-dependent dehydrogenase (short-subunit alcohol dehydrogenase family)